MTATFLIALLATVPAAALLFAAAAVVERLGGGLRLRLQLWGAALSLPLVIFGLVIALDLQDRPKVSVLVQEPVAAATASDPLQEIAAAAIETREVLGGRDPAAPIGLLLLGLYATGVLLRGGLSLARAGALRRTLRASRPMADHLALDVGLSPGRLRTAAVTTPLLTGLGRPIILIPERMADALPLEALRLVCRHELAHHAHGHPRQALVQELMAALLWFNPPWAASRRRLLAVTEELADRDALAGVGASERRLYAETLVAAFRGAGGQTVAPAFTGAAARRRLTAILHPKEKSAMLAKVLIAPVFVGAVAASSLAAVALAAEPVILTLPATTLAEAAGSVAVAVEAYAGPSPVAAPAAVIAPQGAANAGPIDYARVPTADREPPLMFNCSLTAEGRTTGCAAIPPVRDRPRAERLLRELEGRAWPMEIPVRVAAGRPREATYETPGATWIIDRPIGKILRKPGPASVFVYADDRFVLSAPSQPLFDETPLGREARESRAAVMARVEGMARNGLPDRQGPLKDEAGNTVGEQQGRMGGVYRLSAPVVLTLDGRRVGRLEADARGELTLDGRRTIDRGTPVPVRDRDRVLRARRDLASLQPGDLVLMPFSPILPPSAALP